MLSLRRRAWEPWREVSSYTQCKSSQLHSIEKSVLTILDSGYTGLQLLTQIIIADITVLKWRGLVSALISAPFIINGFIGANISSAIVENSGWRWGCTPVNPQNATPLTNASTILDGMFAILVPASLAPLIVTLLWAELKAKRLGLVGKAPVDKPRVSISRRVSNVFKELDIIGMILLGAAVALILLPLTLSQTVEGKWQNRVCHY